MTRTSLLNTPGSKEARRDKCDGEEGRLASWRRRRSEADRSSGAGWVSAHCRERKTRWETAGCKVEKIESRTVLVAAWIIIFYWLAISLKEFHTRRRLWDVLITARMRPSLANTSFLPTRRRQELEKRGRKYGTYWNLGEHTSAGLSPGRSPSSVFLNIERRHSPAQKLCNFQPGLASCEQDHSKTNINTEQANHFAESWMQDEPEVYKGREGEVLLKRLKPLLRRLVRQRFEASQCLQIKYALLAALATISSVIQLSTCGLGLEARRMQKGRNSLNSSSSSGIFASLSWHMLHLGFSQSELCNSESTNYGKALYCNNSIKESKRKELELQCVKQVKIWTGAMINFWHVNSIWNGSAQNNVPPKICSPMLLHWKYEYCPTVKRSRHNERTINWVSVNWE